MTVTHKPERQQFQRMGKTSYPSFSPNRLDFSSKLELVQLTEVRGPWFESQIGKKFKCVRQLQTV